MRRRILLAAVLLLAACTVEPPRQACHYARPVTPTVGYRLGPDGKFGLGYGVGGFNYVNF